MIMHYKKKKIISTMLSTTCACDACDLILFSCIKEEFERKSFAEQKRNWAYWRRSWKRRRTNRPRCPSNGRRGPGWASMSCGARRLTNIVRRRRWLFYSDWFPGILSFDKILFHLQSFLRIHLNCCILYTWYTSRVWIHSILMDFF